MREVEDYLTSKETQEEHESHELKLAGETHVDACKREMARDHRDNFAFRNKEGRLVRGVDDRLISKQQHDEHESHELKWVGEKDAEAYEKEMAQKCRDSLAFRNEEGRCMREVEEHLKSKQTQEEH